MVWCCNFTSDSCKCHNSHPDDLGVQIEKDSTDNNQLKINQTPLFFIDLIYTKLSLIIKIRFLRCVVTFNRVTVLWKERRFLLDSNSEGFGMSKKTVQPLCFCLFLLLSLFFVSPVSSQLNILLLCSNGCTSDQSNDYLPIQINSVNLNQTGIWNQTFSQSTYDRGYAIVECQEGGFAIIGDTKQEGAGFHEDIWLLRVNTTGELLWNSTFGTDDDERAFDLVECQDGGFILLGFTGDIFILRTDSMGNELWNHTINTGQLCIGYSIVRCQTGGYAILGNLGHEQARLFRINDNGWLLWNCTYDITPFEGCDNLVECKDGGFAFAGTTDYAYTPDAFLYRTDENGSLLWTKTYSDRGVFSLEGIVECEDGGFALVGSIHEWGGIDFDIWLVRTNSMGVLMWNRTYGSETRYGFGYSIVQTSSGGFALTGQEQSISYYDDVVFIVTDSMGDTLIDWRIGGFFSEIGNSLIIYQDQGFAIVGETLDTVGHYNVFLVYIPVAEETSIALGNEWVGVAIGIVIVVSVAVGFLAFWLRRRKMVFQK